MEEGILTLLKTYLPQWIIGVGVILFFIALLFKQVRDSIKNIKMPKFFKRKTITVTDLNTHQFFVFIDYMESYKINMMDFGCEGRTKVFREYFKIRCITFRDMTRKLITEDILDLTSMELKNKVFSTLYTSINETNKSMLEQCSNDEERDVVSFMVDKFNRHADSSIEAFKEVIETIFDSGFAYNDNVDRLNAMLNVFLFAFVATFADLEKVLFKVNGYLSGKHYKGVLLK